MDLPFWMVGIFALAVIFLVVNTIFAELDDSDTVIGNSAEFEQMRNDTVGLLDSLVVFSFYGGFFLILVLAAMTRSTPLMFGVGIMFLVVMVFIAPIFSNTYETIADHADMEATGHTGTDEFFENLPTFVLLGGAAVLIVMRLVGMGGGGRE